MERPAGVNEENWRAFVATFNAAPIGRRTVDIPTTDAEARSAIIRMVESAIEARTAAASNTGGGGERAENLKAADIPVFNNMSKFPEYYSQLRFYMRGQVVSWTRCRQACFLILSKWEGPQLSKYAQEVDASTLARATWEETQTRILEWLNEKFRSKTDLADANTRWLEVPKKLQAKHFKSGLEFYLAFETELADYNAACLRTGRPLPNANETTRHFVNSLPPAIAARVRESASDLDTDPYDTYRTKIANVWTAHQVAEIKINQIRADTERASVKRGFADLGEEWDEGEARPAQFIRGGNDRKTPTGRCREPWDKAPRNLQGTIFLNPWMTPAEEKEARARYQRVKNAGVCARCRQKQGHAVESFEKLPPFGPNPAIRYTEAQNSVMRTAVDQGDVDEQLEAED